MKQMDPCYLLRFDLERPQTDEAESFAGGKPRIPPWQPIPICGLCQNEQAFYFQVAFPVGHEWPGHTLAVFACSSCMDEDLLIPQMLRGPLCGIEIPEDFLERYQVNFRLLIFPTAEGRIRSTYSEKVSFQSIELQPEKNLSAAGNKIGGRPNWLLEDESPGLYAGKTPMYFLMQLEEGLEFAIVPDAPPQVKMGLDGRPKLSTERTYELFLRNGLYFFGTRRAPKKEVYIITQVD